MASATQIAPTVTIAPTQLTDAIALNSIQNPAIRATAERLLSLGLPILPVAPAQDIEQYHTTKKGKKVATFTGKNPSYLNRNGKPYKLNHGQYQQRQPSERELKAWFANPDNGIGTLGGINGIYWPDFDVKNFGSQAECDRAFNGILEAHPALKETWQEQTHSGGYRLGVRLQQKPDFTNFALEPGGKHRGEVLGEGRFTVLAPTIGTSGNPYRCIQIAPPVEFESAESIGLFSTKSASAPAAPKPQRIAAPIASAGMIALEKLGNERAAAALNGVDVQGDRSATLTMAYREWSGWANWAADNGIAISGSAADLAHQAGTALDIDADRVNRILKGIDSTACQPAAQHQGGDESCWKKIRRLDRATFESAAPASIRAALEALYAKTDSGSGSPPDKGSSGGGDDGGDDGDEPIDRHNPDLPFKEICADLKLDFQYCCTRQQFDGSAYRALFGGEAGDWTVINAAFYHWNGRYWECKSDVVINKLIADYGEQAFKVNFDRQENPYITRPYETNKHKESAFKYCRSRLERSGNTIANAHLLAFNDCVVDLRTGQTMPHDKTALLTNLIPHNYQSDRDCPEVFHDFIVDSFGEEMLPIVRAFTAMFLDPTAPYGRFPHLIGKSGGGKGTLGRFWSSLFGLEGSGSATAFSDIATPEGRHQYLTGKRIFGFPDVGGYCQGLRAFYELIDNGAMTGRALFSPTAYSVCWNVRFWVASVDHLQIENAGDGWARRAYPMPVRQREVIPDPELKHKLEAVKAEVISWALAMPRAERDAILLSPPTTEQAKNFAHDAALYGDSTRSFVELCLRPSTDATATITSDLLHSYYEAYCRIHGYSPLAQSKFIAHLRTVLPRNYKERSWSLGGKADRTRVPAHWIAIVPIMGVFVSSSGNQEFQQNPQWTCLKSQCQEGGLEQFEEYWHPCANQPLPAFSDLPEPPKPLPRADVQDVQPQNDAQSTLDTPKPLPRAGVQSGSIVHSESLDSVFTPISKPINSSKSAGDCEQRSTAPGQTGHAGHAHGEPISAIEPNLDTLDTLDIQPELLPPDRLAKAVAMLTRIDSVAAFKTFYQCYQGKSQVQQDQIMEAAPQDSIAAFYEWWNCPEVQALSTSIEPESAAKAVSESAIAASSEPVPEPQPNQNALTEKAIAAMSGMNCWLAADYKRIAQQFEEAVLVEAIEQLPPRERETVERLRKFIDRG